MERKVIYHLLDAVGEMLGDRAPERLVESVAGEAEVRAVFDLSGRRGNKADVVAGCLVNLGALDGSERFRVMRDGAPAHEGLLECESIRRHKLEVTAVGKGTDCGVSLRWGEVEVRVGDVLQCVKMVKKKAAVERVATGGARVLGVAREYTTVATSYWFLLARRSNDLRPDGNPDRAGRLPPSPDPSVLQMGHSFSNAACSALHFVNWLLL